MDCCSAADTDGGGIAVACGFKGVAAGAGLRLLRPISGTSYNRNCDPVAGISVKK